MPRFAILIHDSPRGLHYDFLLEAGEVLKTWALPKIPEPGKEIECEALPDHRLVYLDYEGPVPGNRGTVTRWDAGTYSVEIWMNELILVGLCGEKLAGKIELRLVPGQSGRWRLTLHD